MLDRNFKVKNKGVSFLVAFTITFAGFFSFGSIAFAVSTGLTIQPIKISHTLNPGETIQGVISLSNASGDEEVEVQTSIEDFVPASGTSDIQFVGRAQGISTVRDWITFSVPQSFIFKRGESKEIPYTIKAPLKAEPGGHFGVMFFKALKKDGIGQLRVGTQVGILLFVTIPGNHLQKGKILDFYVAPFVNGDAVIPFNIKFENTGTVHFEPKGTIVVTNMFGREVAKVPVEGQVVLPTGVRDIVVGWQVVGFLFGRYTATLTIVDPNGEVLTGGTVVFYTAPIWYVINFIASVIVLWLVLRFLKKKVKITFNP